MSRLGTICALIVTAGAANGAAARAAVDFTPRAILASGDVVAGFGRIGVARFHVQDIDARGRVLSIADTSDGLSVLFWADDDELSLLWSARADGGTPHRVASAATTRDGYVVVSGTDGPDRLSELTGLYEVRRGALRALARQGDLTSEGEPICYFTDAGFVVNDARAIAFEAFTAAAGSDCGSPSTLGVHLLVDGAVRTLSRSESNDPADQLRLLGLTAGGTVIAAVGNRAIVALGEGQPRIVVETGMNAPSGALFTFLGSGAGNDAGEVVFIGEDSAGQRAVYRTDQGSIVRVVGAGDVGPEGTTIRDLTSDALLLNDSGTVVVRASFVSPDGYTENLGRYPASGVPGYAGWATGHAINADGAVAVGDFNAPPAVVARWTDERVDVLARAGDAAPNGSLFAIGGIDGSSCLGADGRVAAMVVDDTQRSGLACGDATGFVKIARAGELAPDGGTFSSFGYCGLPGDGSVLFAAARDTLDSRSTGVYRATPQGLETVARSGSDTGAGLVEQLLPINAEAGAFFAFNQRGTVLVRAVIRSESVLLRRRPGEGLERVRFELDAGGEATATGAAGLTEDDTVIALVQAPPGVDALVASNGGPATVLASTADTTLPGGPFVEFSDLRVAGDRIVFFATDATHRAHPLTVAPAGGVQPFGALTSQYSVIDLSPAHLLVSEAIDGGSTQYLFDADGAQPVGTRRGAADFSALAVNDRDNILFLASESALGTQRWVLALSGPAATAACFIPPTVSLTPVATATVSPSSTPTVPPGASPSATATLVATSTATHPAVTITPPPSETDSDGCQIPGRTGSGSGAAWLLGAGVLLWTRRATRARPSRRRS